MGLFARMWQGARAADVTLSLGDVALRIIGISTGLSAVAGLVTWFVGNPYAALVVGLATWIAIAILLLLIMTRRTEPGASPESVIRPESTNIDTEEPLPQESLAYEPEGAYFKEQPVYIADLARKDIELKGKTFEDCQIFGPAIIAPYYGSWPFYKCTWAEDDPDNLLWEGILSREKYVGVIGIETDCTFRRCHFVRVGILVNEETYKRLKAGTMRL